MEKRNSLFKNTIYKSILSFVNIVIPIIIGPYIVRLLDVELYGIYNRVFSEFQMFLAFASFGIYNYGVREISKFRDDKEKVSKLYSNLFVISLFSNLAVLIIYMIYTFLTSKGIATKLYLVMIIQIFANIIYVEFVNEALENYRFITIKSVIVKLIYFISLLLFVRNPDDIVIYAVIICLTVFINNFVSFLYANKRIQFNWSDIHVTHYLKPLFAVLVISNVDLLYSQLDKVMLGRYVDDVSVTLYYIPYYLVGTLASIPQSVVNVSIPRLSYLLRNEGKEIYQEKLNYSISSLLFIIVPMCFGLFVIADEVIFLYAGEKYSSAVLTLMIASVVRIAISLESVMNHLVLYPNDKENRIVKVSLICGVLNLFANFILVKLNIFNPSTALITTGLSEMFVFIWHYIYAKTKLKIAVNIFSKKNLLYFALGLLFIPISLFVRMFHLGFVLTLCLIIVLCVTGYFVVLYYVKDNNLMFILSKFKRGGRK